MASLQFHDADWHGDLHTPIADGKYVDPKTGELHTVTDSVKEHGEPGSYRGPPSVDIIIQSIHADTVVKERKLNIDSVVTTPYAIRVMIRSELVKDEFNQIAGRMVNGIWDEKK